MPQCWPRASLLALSAALAVCAAPQARAESLSYCDAPAPLSAVQQNRLLRVSAIVKQELERSGASAALVSRSGLNLRWFDMRYSHAGLSLLHSPDTRWAVRQLYFACEEQQPRVFDQGLAAFVLGTEDPRMGYLSIVPLPAAAAAQLEAAALDKPQALGLLASTYSANAYAFSTQYQNCNQWLIELMGWAWSGAHAQGAAVVQRAAAQDWLKASGYEPSSVSVGWRPLTWLTAFSPWLHRDDHPEEDMAQARFRVSMPESIEAFVRRQWPQTERIEVCHTEQHVVLRKGWTSIADGCVPGDGDRVIALD